MPKKNCPLCGGKLKNNYCESCGYNVPDDEDLSALYNYDPSDYPQENVQPFREITPEFQAEEIYPNRPADFDTAYEQPKFKVRDESGRTVHQDQRNQSPPPSPFAQQNVNNDNAYGGYNTPPNAGAQNNGGNYVPPPSPFANQGGQSGQYASTGDFIKAYWWLLLLSFLAPVVGIILLLTVGKAIDRNYKGIVIAAIVLGFVFPP